MLGAIANAIQRTPKAWTELWHQAQNDLVRHAAALGDPEISRAILGRLKPPPVGAYAQQELGQELTEKITKRMETALKDNPSGDLAKMARILKALQMAQDQYGRGYKPGAINQTALMQKLQELQQKPEVQDIFNDIKKEVLSSPKAQKWAKDQAAYLNSRDFQHALALMPAAERRDFLNAELVKLASLSGDPKLARRVLAEFTMREMEANPGAMLSQALKAPGGKEMLQKTTTHLLKSGPLKDAKHVMTCAHEICEAMETLKHLEHEAHPGAHVADHLGKKADELEKLVKAGKGPADGLEKVSALRKARDWVADLDKKGRFSGLYVGASAFFLAWGVGNDGLPKDFEGWARAGQTGGYMLASSEGLAKLIAGAEGLEKMGRLATALKVLKVLGPVADAVGAGLDFEAASKYAKKGDEGRAWGYRLSGVGGTAMAAGGILLFTPAAPVGAAVIVAGAIVTGIGMGVRYAFGRSNEAQFLYDLDKDLFGKERAFYTP